MKNTFKLLGIIALAAVIGFSMAACKDDSGGGDGGVDWVGTWVDVDDATFYFTLNADKSWTLCDDRLSGSEWKYDEIGLGSGPAIVLVYIDGGSPVGEYLVIKEIIDSKTVEFIETRAGDRHTCKKQ